MSASDKNLVERFANLKKQRAEADRAKVAAETRLKSVEEALQSHLREMAETFGVKTLTEAKDLLAEKEAELAGLAEEIDRELATYEAQSRITE